jgi:3-hydroxyisobutyrate dehydrogenase-like beta-hydroxyacid dehydrogenase
MMGSAMAARLRSTGHTLRVWNRSADKAAAWVKSGGVACASPREAATGAQQAHVMVADDGAVEAIVFGEDGILNGLQRGSAIIDHSTVAPSGAKQRSRRLHDRGFTFLQCPVFGSPPNILEGKGLMLIGGEETVYNKVRDVLNAILPDHFRAGEKPEDAATFKLMGNSMLVNVVEALAEFYAIAKANGIDPHRAFSLLNVFNPCGTIQRRGPRMAAGDYQPMFTLTMALKDVSLMLDAAGPAAQLPSLETISAKMKRLVEAGKANLDLAALGVDVIPAAG